MPIPASLLRAARFALSLTTLAACTSEVAPPDVVAIDGVGPFGADFGGAGAPPSGYANGDGPCASSADCETGVCVTSGAHAGTCQECGSDTDCGGSTPVCAPNNECVQCTAHDATACSGATPVCDFTTKSCVGCDGDAGSAAARACGQAAPFCDLGSGSCVATCHTSAECGAGKWCSAGTCTAKQPNGASCTTFEGCASGVCDVDSKCGRASGRGPCSPADALVVCRGGACSETDDVCKPFGGCAVDLDCGPSEWCDTASFACTPKIPNGSAMPDVPEHAPALTGSCTAEGAAAVCASGVCDASDSACGFAVGDGPCTASNGSAVCRSGRCDAGTSLCAPAPSCDADSDCDPDSEFCNTETGACSPKLPNGARLPALASHAPPLSGACTAEAAATACLGQVCDASDDACGFRAGHGTCTAKTAGTVCRSSVCSPNGGVCIPSGGCAVDADCGETGWCDTEVFACRPKRTNGTAIPSVGGHAPALEGTCTAAAGTAVCLSGVCDDDGACGYADGHGACNPADATGVCRSGSCSAQGVCKPGDVCLTDGDCDTAHFCDTEVLACTPKLPNGANLPTLAGHAPKLDGACSAKVAHAVCASGVCDEADDRCGHAVGRGPCSADDGETVCRTGACAAVGPNAGTCGECATNEQCAGGQAVCDRETNECVQCTKGHDAACQGATPVCGNASSQCVPCDGDKGDASLHACPGASAPLCVLGGAAKGTCGRCEADSDCEGRPAGGLCNPVTGACGHGCSADDACGAGMWCDTRSGDRGSCSPKLANGEVLPEGLGECSATTGARVCESGACDADGRCGHPNGRGPCSEASVCRSGACDGDDHLCGLRAGGGACSDASACREGLECDARRAACSDPGQECTRDADCKGGAFCGDEGACEVGEREESGLRCAAAPGRRIDGQAALAGLLLAIAGLARRRHRA